MERPQLLQLPRRYLPASCQCSAPQVANCPQVPVSDLADPMLQVLAYVNKVQDVSSNVDHDTFTLEQVTSH